MSNTDTDNNITLYAPANIRGTIMRTHSSDPRFVVKDVYITNMSGELMPARDEIIPPNYNHTMIQIVPPGTSANSSQSQPVLWIMKLSATYEPQPTFGELHAVSRGTFLDESKRDGRIISRLNISLSIPAMNFNGAYDVCVVMCRPEHATRADDRYNVTAHGTINFDQLFGEWTFTWQNLTNNNNTVTVTDANTNTFNSASH